jgi:hypothetical protein
MRRNRGGRGARSHRAGALALGRREEGFHSGTACDDVDVGSWCGSEHLSHPRQWLFPASSHDRRVAWKALKEASFLKMAYDVLGYLRDGLVNSRCFC